MAQASARHYWLAAFTVVAVAAISAWLMLRTTDEDAWREAKAANTQEAYEHYVSEWPSGAFIDRAKDSIAVFKDERAWRSAVEEDTAEGYAIYRLGKSRKYEEQARERQAVLVEASDWEWAQKKGTHKAFLEYARRWPNGPNIAAAKDRLRGFERRAEYRRAAATDTITALESFMLTHPDTPDAASARGRVDALKRDPAPFLAARKSGTLEAFEQFLRDYPGHISTAEAEKALKDLKGVDIFRLVAEKRVSITIKGGGLTRARVTLTNNGDSAVSAIIPAAVMFASRNPKIQNMVTTAGKLVALKPNETKSLSVPVACANMPRRAPGSSTDLFLEQVANRPALQRIVRHMQTVRTPFAVRQAAVWIVTDNATYQGLSRLNTMRPSYAVSALRLLDESGVDLRGFGIWRGGVRLLQNHMAKARGKGRLDADRNAESLAIWLYERLNRYGGEKVKAVLKDGLLNRAAGVGWGDMIQLLIKNGHDVNERDILEETPLHDFVRYARYLELRDPKPTIEALIGAGADLDARDKKGRTPIFYAGAGVPFEVLAAAGADLSAVDKNGLTLLHALDLRLHKNSNALEILSKAGLDSNRADNKGNTPLHHAVRIGDKDKIRGLLLMGAVNSPNKAGKEPIDMLPEREKRAEFERLLNGQ